MITKSQIAFSIEGEFLTSISRNLVLEGNYRKAIEWLSSSLIGENAMESAVKILAGDAHLTGINSLTLVEFEDNQYKSELKKIYNGAIKIREAWFKPHRRYVSFSEEAGKYAWSQGNFDLPDNFVESHTTNSEFLRLRTKFYTQPGEEVLMTKDYGPVVFKSCYEPPFFWNVSKDPETSLANFLEVNRLLEIEGSTSNKECVLTHSEDFNYAQINQFLESALDSPAPDYDQIASEVRAKSKFSIPLEMPDGNLIQIPGEPLMHWVYDRSHTIPEDLPEWEPISPPNLKMFGDNRYHSDWVLGAGIPIENAYGDIYTQAFVLMHELQTKWNQTDVATVVAGDDVIGVIGEDVAVVDNLNEDIDLSKTKAIITLSGGKMAHLSILALERSIPIVLVVDKSRFVPGSTVTISTFNNKVTLW